MKMAVQAAVDAKEGKSMLIRKLLKEEHHKTRVLWEKVFSEDTKGFLDYYYFIKTQDNEIYVLEEDDAIRSMVQLNPYTVQIENTRHLCHYVVGVSTEAAYRGRGYFREVFYKALADMYAAKEPFTYLMPAAKEIYLPYGFRFVYEQTTVEMTGCEMKHQGRLKCRGARISDADVLAAFFEEWQQEQHEDEKKQIYAVRDTKYWQTKIFELQSEDGGLQMVYFEQKLVGIFSYYDGDVLEILEPLFLPEYEEQFFQAVYDVTGDDKTFVKCIAYPFSLKRPEVKDVSHKPMIMARVLHLETLFKAMKVKVAETMDCSFAVMDSLIVPNNRVWRLYNEAGSSELQVRETEDSQGVIPIEELTEFLFGQKSLDEIEREEFVVLTEELKQELGKLQLLERTYLNEIV